MVEGKEKRGELVKQWFGVKKKGGVEVGETGNYFFLFFFLVSKDERHRKTEINPNGEAPWTMSSFLRTLGGYNKKNLVEEKEKKKKKILFFFFFFFFPFGRLFLFYFDKHATIRNKDQSPRIDQASSKSFCRRHKQSGQSHYLACYQWASYKIANNILVLTYLFDVN